MSCFFVWFVKIIAIIKPFVFRLNKFTFCHAGAFYVWVLFCFWRSFGDLPLFAFTFSAFEIWWIMLSSKSSNISLVYDKIRYPIKRFHVRVNFRDLWNRARLEKQPPSLFPKFSISYNLIDFPNLFAFFSYF